MHAWLREGGKAGGGWTGRHLVAYKAIYLLPLPRIMHIERASTTADTRSSPPLPWVQFAADSKTFV